MTEDRVRRRVVLGSAAIIALLVSGAVWAAGLGPRMLVPQGVPDDVSVIVDRTWPAFLEAFPARHDCVGDVTLLLVFEVEGGAASYRPDEATIRIEIPTTPERFEESLAHELGHHLEHRCPVVTEIGAEFIAGQGMNADSEWFERDPWFESPTEHFAEAVVQVVLGERRIHADRITLNPRAIAIVREWGLLVGSLADEPGRRQARDERNCQAHTKCDDPNGDVPCAGLGNLVGEGEECEDAGDPEGESEERSGEGSRLTRNHQENQYADSPTEEPAGADGHQAEPDVSEIA